MKKTIIVLYHCREVPKRRQRMNDCYYGLDSCFDDFQRECGCVGCWVLDPPEYLQNTEIVEQILRFVPHAIIDDTIQFDIDHLPTNELIFELILKGFKVEVPELQSPNQSAPEESY